MAFRYFAALSMTIWYFPSLEKRELEGEVLSEHDNSFPSSVSFHSTASPRGSLKSALPLCLRRGSWRVRCCQNMTIHFPHQSHFIRQLPPRGSLKSALPLCLRRGSWRVRFYPLQTKKPSATGRLLSTHIYCISLVKARLIFPWSDRRGTRHWCASYAGAPVYAPWFPPSLPNRH